MNQDKAVMIVLVTVMLAAASLEKVAAEEDWIPLNADIVIPIDYDNSRFELRTEIDDETDAGRSIGFYLQDNYDEGKEQGLMGWIFWYRDNEPSWGIFGCNFPNQPRGSIDKSILSSEQIWTVWKSADNKLNVLCNGQDILRDFAPTKDSDPDTGCGRSEGAGYEPDELDWQPEWDTKVASVYLVALYNNDDSAFDNIKAYRIVPHPDEQDDEHDAWTSGVSGLMVSTLIAVIPFWRF